MKKLLLKKLKQDFKKNGFDLVKITFILNYIDQTMTTDGEQRNNSKNIAKTEHLDENSAFVSGLADQVKKEIHYEKLEHVILVCDLETFEVNATLLYLINGEKKKKTLTV